MEINNKLVRSRVLIQTDHPAHLPFLTRYLEEMKLNATFVTSGEDVIQQLDCSQFDLLLLDASHADVVRYIRQELKCEVSIMVLARLDEIELAEQCVAAGAQDYLSEPFNPTLFRVRVIGCLEMRWLQSDQEERERVLRLDHDMEIARRIQNNFLPSVLPTIPGWEIAARFYPARVVAGDWYDAFPLSGQRRFAFLVADVCDKGVPSALFMALCRSLIRAFSQQNLSLRWMDTRKLQADDFFGPSKQLTQSTSDPDSQQYKVQPRLALPSAGMTALKTAVKLTNRYILENHAESNMFVTMFFGVLDPANGSIAYINAGHNAPFVLDARGNIKTRLKTCGPAVGVLPDASYDIRQVDLEPGDFLYVFSDGVPDVANPQGEHFNEKRLTELIQQPHASAKSLLDLVDTRVHEHMQDANQFDDITMMALHYVQPEPGP
jgi:sigma-B regulation protein RsbU (phosphoserine phosphatase)